MQAQDTKLSNYLVYLQVNAKIARSGERKIYEWSLGSGGEIANFKGSWKGVQKIGP